MASTFGPTCLERRAQMNSMYSVASMMAAVCGLLRKTPERGNERTDWKTLFGVDE